jgi:hypothetical protein
MKYKTPQVPLGDFWVGCCEASWKNGVSCHHTQRSVYIQLKSFFLNMLNLLFIFSNIVNNNF